MEVQDLRSSDRVYIELPITIMGTEAGGREFVESTKTLVLSRRGAKIISRNALSPRQKLRIRCLKTGLETELRVVGPVGGDEEGSYYGVELLHPEVNLWGINFPPLSGGENSASRVLLECTRCYSQEVAYLDVFELEVLLANEVLMRRCSRCSDVSLWMQALSSGGQPPTSRVVPTPRRAVHERKQVRINLKVEVCIRHPVNGEEIVHTENVSRGGFRFRSRKDYPLATLFEAALPYVPGAANVFAPARIVYKGDQAPDGTYAYGVAYIPTQMASSLTGMRITSLG